MVVLSLIHESGKVKAEEYTEEGIVVEAVVPNEIYGRLIGKYQVVE